MYHLGISFHVCFSFFPLIIPISFCCFNDVIQGPILTVLLLASLTFSSSAEPKSSSPPSSSSASSSSSLLTSSSSPSDPSSNRRSYSSYESRDAREDGYPSSSGGRSNRYESADDSDDGYTSQSQPKSKKTVILAIPVKLALQQAERDRQALNSGSAYGTCHTSQSRHTRHENGLAFLFPFFSRVISPERIIKSHAG